MDVEPLCSSDSQALFEVGWSHIKRAEFLYDEPILKCFNEPFPVLHWHGDRIILPSSAILLASSTLCKEQFFRIGQNAYGLQFHAEIINEMVHKWIREDLDFIIQALGPNARLILLEQQKLFCNQSLETRLAFLNFLFMQFI